MAAQSLPEFESQVQLNATVGNAPFAESFSQIALTPDTLGQVGATLATNASMELAKRRGIQAGLNPSGATLPPLTKADRAFVDAYQNQAHATLSNQGQKVINEADEALSKLNKIGPGDIAEYQKTVQKSFEDILNLAPIDAKTSLFNSFNQSLTSSVHNYQTRLISQQKAEQKANSDLALTTAANNVHNSWLDGNMDKAQQFLGDQIEQISKGVSAGIYTKVQGDALKKSAALNYLTGEQIQRGIAAHNEGKSAEWLDSLVSPKSKPKNISWSDWETVGNNARNYLANREKFTRQSAQVIAGHGYLEIANQTMTADKLAQYQEDLKDEPELFNNLAIAFAHNNHSASASSQRLANISANWQNIDVMKMASNEDINKSFTQLSELYQQQQQAMGNPISKDEADFVTAASSAVPVPLYTQSLQRQISSGIPGQMTNGIHYYNRLKALPGNKSTGFLNDQKAVAMKENFQNALSEGKTEEEAANIAQEIWNQKDKPDVVEFIKAQTDSALRTFADTTPNSYQWARNKLSIGGGVTVENPGALAGQWRSLFSTAMKFTQGNVAVSEQTASEGMNQTFGESIVNGYLGYMQYAPEKMIGLGKAAVPLMQEDIYQQLKPMVEFSKKAYEAGAQPFYYEIGERPDYKAYREAQNRLRFGKDYISLDNPKGLIEAGNIDLNNRPSAPNQGKTSTVLSTSIEFDGQEVLIPRVSDDGKVLSIQEAKELYKKTGKHLGKFDSPDNATAFAKKLHLQQEQLISGKRGTDLSDPTYAQDKSIIKNFEKGAPLTIRRIYHNGDKQEWSASIKSNPNQSLDVKTGELIGAYDIGLFDPKTGATDSFFGVFPNGMTHASWKPNTQWIRKNYLSVAGIVPKDEALTREQAADYLARGDEIDYQNSFAKQLNQAGRGFR